ncbi:MAG: hypothetical protein QXI84_10535 [Thermofilaceae archaeon]
MTYFASRKWGLRLGLLHVVLVHLSALAAMAVVDVATGLASRANAAGLHPIYRTETALFLSVFYMLIFNVSTHRLLSKLAGGRARGAPRL